MKLLSGSLVTHVFVAQHRKRANAHAADSDEQEVGSEEIKPVLKARKPG